MTAHPDWCDGNGSIICWDCDGAGSYHDCGDDCCPHLDPEFDHPCPSCEGRGVIVCIACHDGEVPEWAQEARS